MSTRVSSIEDVTREDVYHALAHDPETLPGIYLDQLVASTHGLTVTLSDELDRSVTYTLTITRAPEPASGSGQLLTERYGDLTRLLQETPRC